LVENQVIQVFLWCAIHAASLLDPIERPETIVRLTVDPMPAPKPALRYLLLPELKEMSPGNPIPNYLKCMLDQDFSRDDEKLGRAALQQADRAARMDKPDWQILLKLRSEGISLLLPDLQKMRFLAQELQERFRTEVEQRRFNDALATAKTMLAMARHMGEHPTLIGDLVAIAIAHIALAPLEDMLAQPGCPNLYWALTHLPAPFISLTKGTEGERVFIQTELAGLVDTRPLGPKEIESLVKHIDMIRGFEPDKHEKTRAWLDARKKKDKYVAEARRRLLEYGVAGNLLDRFPTDQIILLDEKRAYEVARDEAIKLVNIPTAKALFLSEQLQKDNSDGLLTSFVPALHKVRLPQGRLDQRLALLRHVEALRMHAASHGGELPAALEEIEVPLPPDPFTGKAFRYELRDGTAHIRGTAPRGQERSAAFNLHYEITIRK
jgi:hypothetical protein